jgi:hypothetical protein
MPRPSDNLRFIRSMSPIRPISPILLPSPEREREVTMRKRCCSECAYSVRPMGRLFRIFLARAPGLLACFNHPDSPGQMTGVACCSSCPNFRPRHKPAVRSSPLDPPCPGVYHIPLTQGRYAIADAEDYERISRHRWCLSRSGKRLYAQRRSRGRTIRMHQFIMKPPGGMLVDHINGNGLDNRRCNLRICSRLENSRNRRVNPNTVTGYKGLYRSRRTGRYYAQIFFEGHCHRIGSFDTAVEAARAYDRRAIECFGPFACLNLPQEHPEHRPRGDGT